MDNPEYVNIYQNIYDTDLYDEVVDVTSLSALDVL